MEDKEVLKSYEIQENFRGSSMPLKTGNALTNNNSRKTPDIIKRCTVFRIYNIFDVCYLQCVGNA